MLIMLAAFIGQFGLGLLQGTFALYGKAVLFNGYSEQIVALGIGLLLTVVGMGQFFTQTILLRPALKRFDEAWLVVIGMVLRTTGLFILAAVTLPVAAALASLFFAIGIGLMMPSLQSLSTNMVADELRGGVLGVYQSTISLSTIVSTAVSGVIFAFNPTAPFWLGALLSLLITLPALLLVRQTNAQIRLSAVPATPVE